MDKDVLDFAQLKQASERMKALNTRMSEMLPEVLKIEIPNDPLLAWSNLLSPIQVRSFLCSSVPSLKLFEDLMQFNTRHYKSAVADTGRNFRTAKSDHQSAKDKLIELKGGAAHKEQCLSELELKLIQESQNLQVLEDLGEDTDSKSLEVGALGVRISDLKKDIKAIKTGKTQECEDVQKLIEKHKMEMDAKSRELSIAKNCFNLATEALKFAKEAGAECEKARDLHLKYLTNLLKKIHGTRQVIKDMSDFNTFVAVASLNPLTLYVKSGLGPSWKVDFSMAADINLNHRNAVIKVLRWLSGRADGAAAELNQCYMNRHGYIKFKKAAEGEAETVSTDEEDAAEEGDT